MNKVLYLIELEAKSRPGGRGYFQNRVKETVQDRGGKIPTLSRIKWGRRVCAWALMPMNMSFWMLPFGLMMSKPNSLSTWFKGRLNERRGNGDLIL